ncbi:hypothetical protein N7478_000161 [Penicillium angulare]|uniref:uncharacterized protein n=1 Tax=Penicillium angulare TaxID=116970 RepID=UPI002541B578|nr:uncharacterized protein N7478_000161 [Penicillium angulare]KAJ5290910.1 hypothetical protein N7478_000161 [Penicillium angulare]
MSSPRKVIVFGATGAIGSVTALQAHQEGAQVSIAVRDTTKPIPILDGLPIEKVQADLTKPETLTAAVRQTGTTAAYIYAVFDQPDRMVGSLTALKEAGITFIVFLSSYTVHKDPRLISPDNYVSYVHGQVEISLEEVFGIENFVTIRPAFFSSNVFWFYPGILAGEVKHPNPECVFDYISTDDIGRVSGVILANGCQEHAVYLAGPEKIDFTEAFNILGEVLDKKIKTTLTPIPEVKAEMVKLGIPEPVAQWIVTDETENAGSFYPLPWYQQSIDNVKKYTKRDPVSFREWAQDNKNKF